MKWIHISAAGANCYWSVIHTANAFFTSKSGSQWEDPPVCVCVNVSVCVWGERRMSFWQFSWLRCWRWGGGRKFSGEKKKKKKRAENWVGDKMIYGRSERRDKWQPKYQIARMGPEEKLKQVISVERVRDSDERMWYLETLLFFFSSNSSSSHMCGCKHSEDCAMVPACVVWQLRTLRSDDCM